MHKEGDKIKDYLITKEIMNGLYEVMKNNQSYFIEYFQIKFDGMKNKLVDLFGKIPDTCEYIVKYYEYFFIENYAYLVFEYFDKLNLQTVIDISKTYV
jgi:serine/threonine protein kinase